MIARILTLLATVLALTSGCDSTEPPPVPAAGHAKEVTTVFNCNAGGQDFHFTVRTMAGQLAMWLPLEFGRPYLVLQRVRSASGAKFEAEEVMVWMHGDDAMLDVAGDTFKGCRRDPNASVWEGAKLDGVDFRATGNEPGWVLEIRGRVMLYLSYDYGASEIRLRSAEPVEDRENMRTTFTAADEVQTLSVEIRPERCTDSMSGQQFESTVTVSVGNRVLRGCGRALH